MHCGIGRGQKRDNKKIPTGKMNINEYYVVNITNWWSLLRVPTNQNAFVFFLNCLFSYILQIFPPSRMIHSGPNLLAYYLPSLNEKGKKLIIRKSFPSERFETSENKQKTNLDFFLNAWTRDHPSMTFYYPPRRYIYEWAWNGACHQGV